MSGTIRKRASGVTGKRAGAAPDENVLAGTLLFLIASYDKTMSADGGHLEFPIGTKNITFVEVYPMTVHAMFVFNWYTAFREDIFKTFSHRVQC